MIAVDTNILVRHLIGDDSVQSPLATRFLEEQLTLEQPGLISVVVLCELAWTLRRVYGLTEDDVRLAIGELLDAPTLVVEQADLVGSALSCPATFPDAMIHRIGAAAGCTKTLTFDKRFTRVDGVELLA